MKDDLAVIYASFAVAKRKPEKIRACTGFELLTSAIPVPRFIPIKLTKRRKCELRPAFTRSQTSPPDRSLKIK